MNNQKEHKLSSSLVWFESITQPLDVFDRGKEDGEFVGFEAFFFVWNWEHFLESAEGLENHLLFVVLAGQQIWGCHSFVYILITIFNSFVSVWNVLWKTTEIFENIRGQSSHQRAIMRWRGHVTAPLTSGFSCFWKCLSVFVFVILMAKTETQYQPSFKFGRILMSANINQKLN